MLPVRWQVEVQGLQRGVQEQLKPQRWSEMLITKFQSHCSSHIASSTVSCERFDIVSRYVDLHKKFACPGVFNSMITPIRMFFFFILSDKPTLLALWCPHGGPLTDSCSLPAQPPSSKIPVFDRSVQNFLLSPILNCKNNHFSFFLESSLQKYSENPKPYKPIRAHSSTKSLWKVPNHKKWCGQQVSQHALRPSGDEEETCNLYMYTRSQQITTVPTCNRNSVGIHFELSCIVHKVFGCFRAVLNGSWVRVFWGQSVSETESFQTFWFSFVLCQWRRSLLPPFQLIHLLDCGFPILKVNRPNFDEILAHSTLTTTMSKPAAKSLALSWANSGIEESETLSVPLPWCWKAKSSENSGLFTRTNWSNGPSSSMDPDHCCSILLSGHRIINANRNTTKLGVSYLKTSPRRSTCCNPQVTEGMKSQICCHKSWENQKPHQRTDARRAASYRLRTSLRFV